MLKQFHSRYIVLVTMFLKFGNVHASEHLLEELMIKTGPGNLKIEHVINACPKIASSMLNKKIDTDIINKQITINNKNYLICNFVFKYISDNFQENITFRNYITNNNLLRFPSIATEFYNTFFFEKFYYAEDKPNDKFSFIIKLIELKSINIMLPICNFVQVANNNVKVPLRLYNN